jgi:hypothetical protein
MAYDPNEPRDKDGKWTKSGGYGPGQKLKGTHRSSEGSVADRKAALEKSRVFAGDRWSRMPNTAKAKLAASAQFSTKTKAGKVGKLPTLGRTEPRMIATPFKPSEPSAHAVAIQTAKALDKDFRRAHEKAAEASMRKALAEYKGPITKLPPGKKPRR